MKQHLSKYATLAARQSGVVLAGDVVSKGITFAISILVMGLVSPREYLVFGLFLTMVALVSQFADAGLNMSFVRFYALYRERQADRAAAHLYVAFRIKVASLLLAGLLLALLASPIAEMLQYPQLAAGLQILGAGLLGIGLFEFFQVVFQARQEFKKLTALRVIEACLKLGFISWFAFESTFTLQRVYQAYVIVPAAVSIAIFFLSPVLRARNATGSRDTGKELYRFGRWLALTTFATMIMQHLDVLMIAPMLDKTPDQAGIYYAAKKFCTPLQVLTSSLITVFYPKAMSLTTVSGMKSYVKRTLQVSIPLSILCLLYLAFIIFAVPVYFPAYGGSLPIVAILFAGWIWTLIGNPITILMLSLNRADVAMKISMGQLAAMVVSHYFFITYYGAIGAAVSSVLLWFMAGIVSFWYIYHHRHEIDHVQVHNS